MERKDKQCVSFAIGTLVFWLMVAEDLKCHRAPRNGS